MDSRNYEFQSNFAKKYVALGRTERDREVLIRQLTQRFGELAEDIQQRIEQAEGDELEQWIERVIPATSLEDVFASK